MIVSESLFRSRECCLVRAVPHVATPVKYPRRSSHITSINHSTTITKFCSLIFCLAIW